MATQTVENSSTTRISDGERVRRWRIEQLRRAGYPGRVAQTLGARRDVDLHLATQLLARGCSAALAVRILL
jgi:hypothetical protein